MPNIRKTMNELSLSAAAKCPCCGDKKCTCPPTCKKCSCNKGGKVTAGGPGSGRHPGSGRNTEKLESHPDHGWLKENGWKRTAGDVGKPQWTHTRYPGKSFPTGKACDLQEETFSKTKK